MATVWDPSIALAKIKAGAFKGVVASTELVLEQATAKILGPPKTGRIYTRRGIKHQASALGEAPATDTGALAQSGRAGYDEENVAGFVNWSTVYAAPLEYGTAKMEPRPYARVTLAENEESITATIQAAVAAELGL